MSFIGIQSAILLLPKEFSGRLEEDSKTSNGLCTTYTHLNRDKIESNLSVPHCKGKKMDDIKVMFVFKHIDQKPFCNDKIH